MTNTVDRPVKGVSTIELFFDLIFVWAVTRTSELLQEDIAWLQVFRALVVFVPVCWLWVGTTMYANLTDVDNLRGRLSFFVVAFAGLGMALALPESFAEESTAPWFAGAYWLGRLVLFAAVADHPRRREFITFPVGAFITGPLLMIGALVDAEWRLWIWGLAACIELVTPIIRRTLVAATPFATSHLADRYSTFVIIAIGETIVASGAAAGHHGIDWTEVVALALGFAVCCSMWWTYFDLASRAIDAIRPVLSYGHLSFVVAIIAVAAGIGTAVQEPTEHLPLGIAALVCGGTALYLITFGFTRWQLACTLAIPRMTGAAACALLILLASALPAMGLLALLALVMLLVNVGDHLRSATNPAMA